MQVPPSHKKKQFGPRTVYYKYLLTIKYSYVPYMEYCICILLRYCILLYEYKMYPYEITVLAGTIQITVLQTKYTSFSTVYSSYSTRQYCLQLHILIY